ncbi:MAG: hypothetical protein II738_06820 [Clostridia bacterium]|nr:hypothetical protein [Clostridia bacterium]
MYCVNCGQEVGNARFCPHCGAQQPQPVAAPVQPVAAPVQPAPNAWQPQPVAAPTYAGNGAVREGVPAPGFSDRVNHPDILAAVKKGRKSAGIFGLFLVPLPLIGFVVYSFVGDKMELPQALIAGGVVSAVFLLFAIIGFVKSRAANTYEATVVDKKTRRVTGNNQNGTYYTEYITIAKTPSGQTKKITEREGSRVWAWNYLQVGDRFKYHPQFNFPYEKFDKAHAPYIACVSCQTKNPVEADRCKHCGLPLLK